MLQNVMHDHVIRGLGAIKKLEGRFFSSEGTPSSICWTVYSSEVKSHIIKYIKLFTRTFERTSERKKRRYDLACGFVERVCGGQDSSGGSVMGPNSETFPTNSAAKNKDQWDRF
ncbi:11790_t:CDS:2, partial [Gigaspora rosea]